MDATTYIKAVTPLDPIGIIIAVPICLFLIIGFLSQWNIINSISDSIMHKRIKKLLADPSEFTPNKAIRISTFIKDREASLFNGSLYLIIDQLEKFVDLTKEKRSSSSVIRVVIHDGKTTHRASTQKEAPISPAQTVIDACEETRTQFKEACSLMIKLCSPPLRDKLDEGSHRNLASLLIRLINLQNSAQTLYDTVFSPLAGLENTKAAQETAENCFPNLLALHDECSSILSGLNGVLEAATRAVCAPISVAKPAAKHAKTAFDQVHEAARKCKSVSVRTKMDKLISQLTVYLEDAPGGTEITNRINSYYLPTLTLVLQDLSTAEKKKSKTIQVREDLCLKTIETVSNILDTHQESEDSADLINITAEVEALHKMAAIKGDLSSPTDLKTLTR